MTQDGCRASKRPFPSSSNRVLRKSVEKTGSPFRSDHQAEPLAALEPLDEVRKVFLERRHRQPLFVGVDALRAGREPAHDAR